MHQWKSFENRLIFGVDMDSHSVSGRQKQDFVSRILTLAVSGLWYVPYVPMHAAHADGDRQADHYCFVCLHARLLVACCYMNITTDDCDEFVHIYVNFYNDFVHLLLAHWWQLIVLMWKLNLSVFNSHWYKHDLSSQWSFIWKYYFVAVTAVTKHLSLVQLYSRLNSLEESHWC